VTRLEDLDEGSIPWIRHVHLDDMRNKPGELSYCSSKRVLTGEGILDLAALLGRIEANGHTGSFSIEMFNDDVWALPAAEATKRCHRSLLSLWDS